MKTTSSAFKLLSPPRLRGDAGFGFVRFLARVEVFLFAATLAALILSAGAVAMAGASASPVLTLAHWLYLLLPYAVALALLFAMGLHALLGPETFSKRFPASDLNASLRLFGGASATALSLMIVHLIHARVSALFFANFHNRELAGWMLNAGEYALIVLALVIGVAIYRAILFVLDPLVSRLAARIPTPFIGWGMRLLSLAIVLGAIAFLLMRLARALPGGTGHAVWWASAGVAMMLTCAALLSRLFAHWRAPVLHWLIRAWTVVVVVIALAFGLALWNGDQARSLEKENALFKVLSAHAIIATPGARTPSRPDARRPRSRGNDR